MYRHDHTSSERHKETYMRYDHRLLVQMARVSVTSPIGWQTLDLKSINIHSAILGFPFKSWNIPISNTLVLQLSNECNVYLNLRSTATAEGRPQLVPKRPCRVIYVYFCFRKFATNFGDPLWSNSRMQRFFFVFCFFLFALPRFKKKKKNCKLEENKNLYIQL